VRLAIGVGDPVMMLENPSYSVISPEAAAMFVKRTRSSKIRLQPVCRRRQDLFAENIIDKILKTRPVGAQNDYDSAARYLVLQH